MATTVYCEGKKPAGKYPKFEFINSFVTANPKVTMLSSDGRNHAAFGGFSADPDTLATAPSGYGVYGSGTTA
jgi:hypothetical protein